MALGDTYNNNNEKKNYSPSVTSGYRFSNAESTIDKTALSFAFWNKLLKISIAPKKEAEGDVVSFDYDNAGAVYLSHTKAIMLYKEVVKFLEDYKAGRAPKNVGVPSGNEGLIYICNGEEFNAEGPCLVIRKIDEKGHCTSTYVYEFRRNTHYSIVNYTEKTAAFESRFYDELEIEQFANLLKSYYESMTMAIAYSIQEVEKYDNSRMNTKLKIIGEKLGVDFTKQNNSEKSRFTNTSYFSNAKPANESNSYSGMSSSYQSGSIDDLG